MNKRKKDFPTTDETRDVLRGHETSIAKAKGCDPSYIFNIKNMEEPDPFAPFRKWFQDCATGGGKVRVYLHDLESIACQAETGFNCEKNLTEKLLNKIDNDAKTTHVLAEASADNLWCERDCEKILDACDRIKQEENELREMAIRRRNALRGNKGK